MIKVTKVKRLDLITKLKEFVVEKGKNLKDAKEHNKTAYFGCLKVYIATLQKHTKEAQSLLSKKGTILKRDCCQRNSLHIPSYDPQNIEAVIANQIRGLEGRILLLELASDEFIKLDEQDLTSILSQTSYY